MDLSLASTDEMIDELTKRYDHGFIVLDRALTTKDAPKEAARGELHFRVLGDPLRLSGLLALLKIEVAEGIRAFYSAIKIGRDDEPSDD